MLWAETIYCASIIKIRLGNMVFCSSGRLPSQVHNYWDFSSLKKMKSSDDSTAMIATFYL